MIARSDELEDEEKFQRGGKMSIGEERDLESRGTDPLHSLFSQSFRDEIEAGKTDGTTSGRIVLSRLATPTGEQGCGQNAQIGLMIPHRF